MTMTGMEILEGFYVSGLFKETDHNEFSRFPCDACNSRLGGERWQIDGYVSLEAAKRGEREQYGLSICRDCYDKLNGVDSEL
jgi:hypothetical protein